VGSRSFDSEVLEFAGRSIVRMRERLARFAPGLATEVDTWTKGLSRTGEARDYFSGGRSILLLLPLFLREACEQAPDVAFEFDLAYSTVCAYYFVRLIDDVVDGDPAARPLLLPLLGFFHAEFQSIYARYFRPESTFWERFQCTWFKMAEATVEQTRLPDLSSDDFIRLSAAKSGGVKIPLAAVCEFYRRPDLIQSWFDFFDAFAAWSQMQDDVFDWSRDYAQGSTTYFLSEARRRKQFDESVCLWILREGIEWGYAQAVSQMRALRSVAAELGSDNLVRFIDYRQMHAAQVWKALCPQLPALARLARVLEG
jgi:hypothetical protein